MALSGAVALLGAIAIGGELLRVPVFAQVPTPASTRGNGQTMTMPNPSPQLGLPGGSGRDAQPSRSMTGRDQNPALRTSPAKLPALSRTPSEVTAVVLAGGEQRGSAVVLKQGSSGSWLVTNRHVVDGENSVCVRTGDGRLWPGITVLPQQARGMDVAFLWLSGAIGLPTATPAPAPNKNQSPWDFPIVRAAGYPVGEQYKTQLPAYRELSGLLLPPLPRPLEGGMQLATTATVRKGMSGGGLFDDQGRLIGLNTTHADPLWPAPLREEGGKAVASELNRKLELVALAIPISRILPLMKGLVPPVNASQSLQSIGSTSDSPSTKTAHHAGKGASAAAICSGYLW